MATRNKVQLQERNKKILELAMRGHTLEEIGNRFGMYKSAIHRILGKGSTKEIRAQKLKLEKEQNDAKYDPELGMSRQQYLAIPTAIVKQLERLLKYAKQRAKNKNLEFSINLGDLCRLYKSACPVTGVKFNSGNRDTAMTIDRIDNTKGYTVENILIVSFLVNRIKSNASVEMLEQIVNFYK
jgi:hypothetical protein